MKNVVDQISGRQCSCNGGSAIQKLSCPAVIDCELLWRTGPTGRLVLARENWLPPQRLAGHFKKIVIGLAQQVLHRPAHFVFLAGVHRNRERLRRARMLAFRVFDIMIIHMHELNGGRRR